MALSRCFVAIISGDAFIDDLSRCFRCIIAMLSVHYRNALLHYHDVLSRCFPIQSLAVMVPSCDAFCCDAFHGTFFIAVLYIAICSS